MSNNSHYTGAFNSCQFSARVVVIHLTALLEYLSDCSIRVFNAPINVIPDYH